MEGTLHDRKDVFERALAEHGARIRGGVCSLIHNAQDAEDVIAEINLALWSSLPGFDGRSSLGTFVYAVSHHKMVDHLRRKYREAALLREAGERTADKPPGKPGAAEDSKVKISFLTPSQFAVLRLMARGLKNEEIGRTLFRSINTVRTHVKHINRKLGTKNRAEAAYVFGRCAGK